MHHPKFVSIYADSAVVYDNMNKQTIFDNMKMAAFFKSKGILGINARNLLYIRPYNKKKAIKMADDKIKTKLFLSAASV